MRYLGLALFLSFGACTGAGVGPEEADKSMKQYELAIGLQGEGNTPGAFQALYKALEIDPSNAKAHLLLGSMFLVNRDDDRANYDKKSEEHFKKALEIQASDDPIPEQSLAADAHNGLGVLYLHMARYDEAIVELTKAVEDLFNRDAFMAWANLGWAYTEKGNFPKAVSSLERSLRLNPKFCVGYYRLGVAYAKAKQFEPAEEALTHAIEADERCKLFQDAWHARGEARMNLGLRDDARSDFERCVELDGNTDAGKACSRYLAATF
jgi:tetratricopeptide (TPR) repeat protein